MDPQTDLPELVEDLEVNIDELSDILSPLLNTPLSTSASSLPLLDKAKLYVLAAYSIESLLYSTLQASGANAKEHPIFKELGRLKGYFGKIKNVEERHIAPCEPKAKLDVGAAARFIKHGLAGNDKHDLERAERMAKEKARAQLKARQINKKFDDEGKEKEATTPKKRDVDAMNVEEPAADDNEEILQGLEEPDAPTGTQPPATKKPNMTAGSEAMDIDSAPSPAPSHSEGKKKRKRRGKNKTTTSTEASEAEADPESQLNINNLFPPQPSSATKISKSNSNPQSTPTSESESANPSKKKRKPRSKKSTNHTAENDKDNADEASTLSARAPKTRSETFNDLLEGTVAEKQEPKRGRGRPAKGRGK